MPSRDECASLHLPACPRLPHSPQALFPASVHPPSLSPFLSAPLTCKPYDMCGSRGHQSGQCVYSGFLNLPALTFPLGHQTSRPSPPCPRSLPWPCLQPPEPLSPASRKIHVGAVATSQGDVPTQVCWPTVQSHPPASRPLAASPSPLHSTAQRKRRIYFQ